MPSDQNLCCGGISQILGQVPLWSWQKTANAAGLYFDLTQLPIVKTCWV